MPENEFEKQVQQKMEEFRVRPSAEVWTAVEARIREKKRRRFIIWWPVLLLLGGGIAAGILLLKGGKGKDRPETVQTETVSKPPAVKINPPVNTDNKPRQSTTGTTNSNNKPADLPGSTTADKKTSNEIEPMLQDKPVTKGKSSNPVAANRQTQKKTSARQLISSTGSKKEKRPTRPEGKQPLTDKIVTTIPATGEPVSASTEPMITELQLQQRVNDVAAEKKPVPDSKAKEEKKDVAINITSPEKNDSAVQKVAVNIPGKEKKKQVWQKSLTFSLGRSIVTDSIGFGFFRVNNQADNYVAGGGGGLGGTPITSRFIGPSTVYYSTSVSAGVQLSKPVSKKLELRLGAGYTYLSSRIRVGSRIDSNRFINNSLSSNYVTRDYFRYDSTGRTNNYHNQYHFVSLSAGLSWRIIQGKKFSLDWVNSLAYKRLLFSSMLHYDRSIPGYYKDNSLLNRNQLFFSTGLSVPFRKGFALEPYFSYGFTPVLKRGNGSAKHYADVGIRLSFQLNKK